MMLLALLVAAFAAQVAAPPVPAPVKLGPKWKLRYFHDENKTSLTVVDLAFPSPKRGVAVGFLEDRKGSKIKAVALVTSDGGKNWAQVELPDHPRSLFFLDETSGWMVGGRGIWYTEEAGRKWTRVWKQEGLSQVWFLSPIRGFAVGAPKAAWETSDGIKWTKIQVAQEVSSRPEFTAYDWITFANGTAGTIGISRPPRRRGFDQPAWVDPEAAKGNREWPSMSIFLETLDAGKTWKASTGSIFGHISRVRMTPDGRGLALFEYRDTFDYPSELYRMNLQTGASAISFHAKDRAFTDILISKEGPAYAAGIEAAGPLAFSPIPGKVKIIVSEDLTLWRSMEVDYRASGRRVVLAAAAGGTVWAATDTGMLLELVRE